MNVETIAPFVSLLAIATASLASADTEYSRAEIEAAKSHFSTPDVADIHYPNFGAPSQEEVELGRRLFFDNDLSVNRTQSCSTCHNPDHGFGDGLKFSIGAMGKNVGRNTPHLYNLAWNSAFFWDGRSHSLEDQALGPIKSPGEMNMPIGQLVGRLEQSPRYVVEFDKVFGSPGITADRIASAIASFERSIIVDNTPLDRYLAGQDHAISPAAKRGMVVYAGKGKCLDCHDGPNFTDNSFHNIGVAGSDGGRGDVIHDDSLKGAFKVPGLRNILYSAPYMHDGSLGTLEEVVRFYNKGGEASEGSAIKPLHLTEREVRDLVAFLGALNQPIDIARPEPSDSDAANLAQSN